MLLRPTKVGIDDEGTSPCWDINNYGIPINQEDMAATLLAFSVNVLVGIEIVLGQPLPENEQHDYLALWRYLGWLLGIDTVETNDIGQIRSSNGDKRNHLVPIDPCGPRKMNKVEDGSDQFGGSADFGHYYDYDDTSHDSIIHSYATLDSIMLHLMHPEQNSRHIATHLLSLQRYFLFTSEVCRKFLGDPLSNELGIPTSFTNWKGWGLESVQNTVRHLCVNFFLYFFLVFLRCSLL